MNFLAHLHLADLTRTSLAGALAGDFVKGRFDDQPEALKQGIWLHRQIDSYIDGHPQLLQLKSRFPGHYRRTSGILLDMAFDHHLARHWQQYHPLPLPQFCQHSYRVLLSDPQLPPQCRALATHMSQGDWLGNYAHHAGLTRAITGIAQRLSRPQLLLGGEQVLTQLEPEILDTFSSLYPQIIDFATDASDGYSRR
ncbi:ACP phosphodiesterase [Ferrimonas kyonanensis]|uniref:acyl carrier protein phosphodiesterase n=1 Tax=Ferrimonas kyonanensis TaxID=364763 RepID=UPI000406BB05|nr:ACP phosphodiesterase [Ferrimonas kyonanensis]